VIICIVGIYCCFFISSCNVDVDPEIQKSLQQMNIEEVQAKLKALRNYEDAAFKMGTRGIGDSSWNYIYIQLKNGENLPDDKSLLKEIGKEAIEVILKSIDNDSVYTRYIVGFKNEEKVGFVSSSYEQSFEYTPDDIR
jgi:hypothetical protein